MQEKDTIIVYFGICIALLVILIGFIAIISFLYQKRQHAFLQQLQGVKNTYEQEGLKTQLEVQEQTLSHISMEIHDNIGQFISLAKLHLNTLDLRPETADAEKVADAVDLLSRAMDDLRDISKSLSLELIRTGGLAKAVESQVNQLRKTARYVIDFSVTGSYYDLEEQKEIILFRILQEALNNVIRHAKASKVDIQLNYLSSQVSLLITDDGVGFNASNYWTKGERGGGGGLNHMLARSSLINAQFQVDSIPGEGASILVTVPYTEQKK